MDLPWSYSSLGCWNLCMQHMNSISNFCMTQLVLQHVDIFDYFTVGPRNHMARALENWYWPLTTRSCWPIGICVRGWRNNETLSCWYGFEFWKRPLKKVTHKYVHLLRFPVRPRSRSDLGMCDLHYLRLPSFFCFVSACCCCCNEPIWLWKTETTQAPKIEVIEYWIFFSENKIES
jgi:hypothetical protein